MAGNVHIKALNQPTYLSTLSKEAIQRGYLHKARRRTTAVSKTFVQTAPGSDVTLVSPDQEILLRSSGAKTHSRVLEIVEVPCKASYWLRGCCTMQAGAAGNPADHPRVETLEGDHWGPIPRRVGRLVRVLLAGVIATVVQRGKKIGRLMNSRENCAACRWCV